MEREPTPSGGGGGSCGRGTVGRVRPTWWWESVSGWVLTSEGLCCVVVGALLVGRSVCRCRGGVVLGECGLSYSSA